MHARELIDVAGLVALNGPLLACGAQSPSLTALEQYWATSKFRFENWMRVLKVFAHQLNEPCGGELADWLEIRATLDEIFTSEILTRVFSAVLVTHDRQTKANLAEPIARSVMTSHMEARHRAMSLLVHGGSLGVKQAAAVNRLRIRAERWTDLLVGSLMHLGDVSEFAVEANRAADFCEDLGEQRYRVDGAQAWRLTLVSMRNAFQVGMSVIGANSEANARITAAVLGCFPGDLFDSTGVFHSLWMMRLKATASDAQGMISELLHAGAPNDPRRHPRLKRRLQ